MIINFFKNKEYIYIFLIFLISILFNQYYGFIGVQPIDSFFPFNSGYDVLNGKYPFKDYWTITGPFMDLVQAFLFNILGVSWFSYVLHASVFNFLFALATFYTLYKFELSIDYCFIYTILVSILAYPSSGTPYVDHQSAYLSTIGVYSFILALKTNEKKYWFFLPVMFVLSFLTKQTPTGYIFLVIGFLYLTHLIFNFQFQNLLYTFLGSFISLSVFFLFLYLGNIPLNSFYQQYILYPMSLGESRLSFLFPFEFQRFFLRFKLIHLGYLILVILAIKNFINKKKYYKNPELLVILSLIGLSFSLETHQLMTINGKYIFFLIPILFAFSHIFYNEYFKNKNYLLYIILILSICSTVYYWYYYIHKRDFMDLSKADINKSIDAKIIHPKLKGLKWITPQYINNPQNEIKILKEAINLIKEDKNKKIIVTDYQFISVINSEYDFSPNKVWYYFHIYPSKDHKYFYIYKDFFINKIRINNIKFIYTVKPLYGDDDVIKEILNKECYKKINITPILDKHIFLECPDLKN